MLTKLLSKGQILKLLFLEYYNNLYNISLNQFLLSLEYMLHHHFVDFVKYRLASFGSVPQV
jgi:hypothetical protein